MSKVSAGLLMVRGAEFLLAHPGGPFFAKKDAGAWTIPKGLVEPGEDLLAAAIREFGEETGFAVPAEGFVELGEIKQKSGKIVHAWAFEGDCEPGELVSNTFSWKGRDYPEVDRVGFFGIATAKMKMIEAQIPFLDRAISRLA